jgi:hypothetical protein
MLTIILLCVATIIVGVVESKPAGWVVLGLAVMALLAEVTHARFGF